jgi:Fe-S cluster assembly protein SufD
VTALSGFSTDSASALAGPDWLRQVRIAAAERFAAATLPTDALEEWRYSRIDALDLDRFRPAGPPESDPGGQGRGLVDSLLASVGRRVMIETRDGYVSRSQGTDRAVTVEELSAPDARPVAVDDGAGDAEADAFATLSKAFAPVPLRLAIGPAPAAVPIVVVHWIEADDAAVFPRLLVEVTGGAEATVLELIAGPGRSLVVPVTELRVGSASRLSYIQVQDLSDLAWQIGLQSSTVDRDATLTSAAVALGGDYARLRTDSAVTGVGGSTRLLAMYFASRAQMHDFRTVQDHRAPQTRSELLYKGAVANSARSVYSGLIRVEKGAKGSNAFQTNRNLVLHEGAHADSVPNLEIEDNDVRCSHASAVGPIDEDQRFYLESRGVPPAVADRLIALGFLDEVLSQLPLGAIVDPLRLVLAERLSAADSAGSNETGEAVV